MLRIFLEREIVRLQEHLKNLKNVVNKINQNSKKIEFDFEIQDFLNKKFK